MSIYLKLAQARVKLQEKELKKSGLNKFSKYDYFELKDFLPEVNRIFHELKLCATISFTEALATMTVHDAESDDKITFTSPMAKAELKGCHDIQNLGAVETYQRRYLYMTALEIVEGDMLDENIGNTDVSDPKPKSQTRSNNSHQDNTSSTQKFDPNAYYNEMKVKLNKAQNMKELQDIFRLAWKQLSHYSQQQKKIQTDYEVRKSDFELAQM